MKRSLLSAVVVAALFFGADASAQDIDEAKKLFSAGAAAYASGQFSAAIQAFEAANKIVSKPAIVFSVAQAHKRQYAIDRNPDHLHAAIQNYRLYIAQVPQGGRRLDATQALGELEQLEAHATPDATATRAAAKEPARVMVLAQAEGAQILFDGKTKTEPLTALEVTPGKHRIKVSAVGYYDEERDVNAVDNALVPLEVQLREKPARLTLDGMLNADVTIDSRLVGTTPLAPLDLSSGKHLVVITKNGYAPFAQEIDLTRDQKKTLTYAMHVTGQRIVANALLLSGGAAVVGGVVFTLVAGSQQHRMNVILDKAKSANLGDGDVQDYRDAHANRDTWTTVAVVAYGVGVAALLTGVVFYAFDKPTVSLSSRRFDDKPTKPAAPAREPTEMSMVPLVGPNFLGGSWTARF